MDIAQITKIISEEIGANIRCDYYRHIEQWRQWWAGHAKSFHSYREMTAQGHKRERKLFSMRMAKKVCEDWASILLNEKTKIVLGDEASSLFLQGENGCGGVLEGINFWDEANRLVEKSFYSGTGAFVLKLNGLRVKGDGTVQKSPDAQMQMDYLPAFCIVPISVRYGKITEVAFVSEEQVRGKTRIYLEMHLLQNGEYVIRNSYYEKVAGKMRKVKMQEGTAQQVQTGSATPFFAVIMPNMVNPFADNLGLGCSVYAQALDNLKGLDLAYNNMCRDFQLGGKKVFYNREMTRTVGCDEQGNPVYIAPDDMMQQLFVSIGDEVLDEGRLIHEFNPNLRVQENMQGVQAQLDYLSFKCGLGVRHYRFTNEGNLPVTATQYAGEKQELKQNAAKHMIVIEHALQTIVRAILWVGKNIMGENVDPQTSISVEFSDGYIISDEEMRQRDRQDVQSGLMKGYEYRMRWYKEDKETAVAQLKE